MINREIRSDIPPGMNIIGKYQRKIEKKPVEVKEQVKDSFSLAENNTQQLIQGKTGIMSASKINGKGESRELPRPMTSQEKTQFKSWFPKLDVDNSKVTAESTWKYNCISWTVGETQQWFWPPSMYPDMTEREAFDKFYDSYSFKPAENGEVARWRNKEGLTHGSVSYPQDNCWESKCGAAARITHKMKGLESDTYGWIDGFYKKEGTERMKPGEPMRTPDNVKETITSRAGMVDQGIAKKFDILYNKWVETRENPDLMAASNPRDFCKGEAYEKITTMGPKIVPLLMKKMADGDFFSIQAVQDIRKEHQGEHKYLVDLKLSKEELANSEQTKSTIMLSKWFQIVS